MLEKRFRHLNYIRSLPEHVIDEPPQLLGDDTAPNPTEALLAALGSCISVGIHANAIARGIELYKVELELEGDINITSVWGVGDLGRDKVLGLTDVRVRVHLDGNVSREELTELVAHANDWSPVANNVRNPVSLRVDLAEQRTSENPRPRRKTMAMVAESFDCVLDDVRRIVQRDLVPIATKVDIEGHYPEDVLRAVGAAGGLGLHLPSQRADRACHMARSIEAMAIAGEVCLSTAFLIWCQSACGWYLENSENGALRADLLPRVAAGQILDGTALSNPMKFLSGIEPLQLVGTRVPGGYPVSGQLPWVSNLGAGARLRPGVRADDGREVMALLSCDAEGLKLTQGAHFTALEGTRTFALRFDDVLVSEDRILADPAGPYLARVKTGFILMQTGMGIGLVAGCIDIMRRANRS
ncbi:MAG TPA: OsmC family protein, partial [Haliangium sp.]|nr:OsmC family protein [Haliangium sp.]